MRLPSLKELGQYFFIKHGHITLAVVLGIPILMSGLGHAFFNPTQEVLLGVVELIGSAFLFVAAFLIYRGFTAAALVCYCVALGCILITVVLLMSSFIWRVSK